VTPGRYDAQVLAALAAVELRPPDAFLWFGRRETVRADDGEAAVEALPARLAQRLHEDFFSTATPRPRRAGPAAPEPDDDGGAFVRALSQANGGRGAWQGGWRVAGPAEDETLPVARPDGLVLMAPAEHVRADGERGGAVSVLQPKELRGISPGFYVALGDAGAPQGAERAGLFWNIAAAGAVTLVARLTYALNGAGLPFALELPAAPARYGGGDSAVLTVARADGAAATTLARRLLRALGAHLAEPAPAFTQPLARGLALAEPPAGGERFGEHRCRLLAAAIVAAAEAGARRPGERLDVVREHFAAAGISLDAPFVDPGSDDAHA
jgi:hypothetical protein